METIIHVSEKKVWKSFHETVDSHENTETTKHKADLPLQKNFRVVDLWKIRGMKKYFNYQ
jgi:hypothetical protein